MNINAIATARYTPNKHDIAVVRPKRSYISLSSESSVGPHAIIACINAWHQQTAVMSSLDDMRATDSYRCLVSYGRRALKWIVDDLQSRPSFLVMAAQEITGDNPVTPAIRGDVRAMSGAWVGWYQRMKSETL